MNMATASGASAHYARVGACGHAQAREDPALSRAGGEQGSVHRLGCAVSLGLRVCRPAVYRSMGDGPHDWATATNTTKTEPNLLRGKRPRGTRAHGSFGNG